jgi:hypothetical protein
MNFNDVIWTKRWPDGLNAWHSIQSDNSLRLLTVNEVYALLIQRETWVVHFLSGDVESYTITFDLTGFRIENSLAYKSPMQLLERFLWFDTVSRICTPGYNDGIDMLLVRYKFQNILTEVGFPFFKNVTIMEFAQSDGEFYSQHYVSIVDNEETGSWAHLEKIGRRHRINHLRLIEEFNSQLYSRAVLGIFGCFGLKVNQTLLNRALGSIGENVVELKLNEEPWFQIDANGFRI